MRLSQDGRSVLQLTACFPSGAAVTNRAFRGHILVTMTLFTFQISFRNHAASLIAERVHESEILILSTTGSRTLLPILQFFFHAHETRAVRPGGTRRRRHHTRSLAKTARSRTLPATASIFHAHSARRRSGRRSSAEASYALSRQDLPHSAPAPHRGSTVRAGSTQRGLNRRILSIASPMDAVKG